MREIIDRDRWPGLSLTVKVGAGDRPDHDQSDALVASASTPPGRQPHPVERTRRLRAMSRAKLAAETGIAADRLAAIEDDPRADALRWTEAETLAAALTTSAPTLHEAAWRHNARAAGAIFAGEDLRDGKARR